MEKLFYSASKHNEKTCGKCHRRKERENAADNGEEERRHQEWLETFLGRQTRDGRKAATRAGGDDPRARVHGAAGDRLPPQTVLARVVRELEDEFSHYKS